MRRAAHWAGGILALAFLAGGSAQAADFGHARLLSAAGTPLQITVPMTGLSAADLDALSVQPAPAADWASAGLTPPVALSSLQIAVKPGAQPANSRILHIHSSQSFAGNLADLLLDVQTATGQQRYQVSILVPGPVQAAAPAVPAGAASSRASAAAVGAAAPPSTSSRRLPMGTITVRQGDHMFRVARRHAVDQVSVYQLMMALQRANPQAFIHDNVNLLKAGAVLTMPSLDEMLSISDAEARRQFVAHTAAFNRLRGQQTAVPVASVAPVAGQAAAGPVSTSSLSMPASAPGAGDRLQLSQGKPVDADARVTQEHALKDAESRVGQLQDNVQNLNKALQAQGEAARSAVADGAKVVTESIDKIAEAISQASQEAANQADAKLEAQPEGHDGQAGANAPANSASGAASSADAAQPSADGSAAAPAARAGATAADSAQLSAGASAQSTAPGAAASGADPSVSSSQSAGALGTSTGPGLAASSASGAGTSVDSSPVAIPEPSVKTEHRVSWIQDHLLEVLSGLLAFIVLLIAWLLRRAARSRDATDVGHVITDAMVQERLQGVDLNLPARDTKH